MAELITARIRRNASELKLHGITENPDELVDRAEAAKLGYREFFHLVLENKVGMLDGRRYQARLKMAGLPHHKTLEKFDVTFQPDLDPNASPSSAPCHSSSAKSAASSSAHPILFHTASSQSRLGKQSKLFVGNLDPEAFRRP